MVALQQELRGRYREVVSICVSAGGAHSLIMVTGTTERAAVAVDGGDGRGEEIAVATQMTDLYGFGWNMHGQLGLGDKENRLLPTRLPRINAGRG